MKIQVSTESQIAVANHREMKQQIDVDIHDSIQNVKIKITLIYNTLDPDQICLKYNNIKLKNAQTILQLVKTYQNEKIVLQIERNKFCCSII